MIEIPGYSIHGQIGRGGMATVYRARQVLLDREVALKVMSTQLAQDPVYAQRFLQEARMLAALNHPHIVPVYDVGVTPESLHYFSMQLLTGGDFADRMRDGLSEQELVRVLVAVANALGFAHSRGYVHRDVAPGNVMFDAHDTPILTDFGIARAVAATSRITQSGLSIGTSHYMSPEQARGIEVDHRSDIYSLGVMTYEALVGTPPFQGEDGFAVAFAHVHDPVPRLPEEAARWQPVIDRCMAKDPAARFADCAGFIEGLREIAPAEFAALGPAASGARTSGPVPPVASGVPRAAEPPPPSAPRVPVWVGLAAGLTLLASVIAGVAWWRSKPAAPPPRVTTATTTSTPIKPKPAPVLPTPVEPTPTETVEAPVELTLDPLPTDAAAVVTEPHTVIDPVATLIAKGRENIVFKRLTAPPITNAVDRFLLALVIEPSNKDAAAGIAQVAQILLDEADAKGASADLKAWLDLIAQAEAVAARHPAALAQGKLAQKRREAEVALRLSAGRAAIEAWDRPTAQLRFGEALQIQPGNKDALAGQKQAAQLGQVGYVFRDRLEGDAAGPQLVVVQPGLALGRYEVSNAEFARYWDAAGGKKFSTNMPRCRDRESFFSASKTRTWRASGLSTAGDAPVVCISHAMAADYVNWLSKVSGRRYRLPKASELAAFSKPVAGCKSNVFDAAFRAEYKDTGGANCDDGFATSARVGQFAAVPPGVFDGDGNVREWVDCGAAKCREPIAVGRSWASDTDDKTQRDFPEDVGFNTIGVRVARELD